MLVIRTAEEMARALDSPLPPTTKQILCEHRDRLAEYEDYPLSELALFIIAQPHDTLAQIEGACSRRLVQVGDGAAAFAILPEIVQQHDDWLELIFILSDDGFGLVLLADLGADTDPLLLAACQHALAQSNTSTAG